jgi:hypothetical protein
MIDLAMDQYNVDLCDNIYLSIFSNDLLCNLGKEDKIVNAQPNVFITILM